MDPSVCPIWATNLKMKKNRETKTGVNSSLGRINQCTSFQPKSSKPGEQLHNITAMDQCLLVNSLLGCPGKALCFTAVVYYLFFFNAGSPELRRLTAVNLCHMVGSTFNFIIPVQKFGAILNNFRF